MNKPEVEPGDELARSYRDASDAEAGRPAAATRAAILAEARAASRRRTPAANDSRYVWRAAAGIAVLGVAVILWRQTERRLTPDLVATTQRSAAVAEPAAATPQPSASADADVSPSPSTSTSTSPDTADAAAAADHTSRSSSKAVSNTQEVELEAPARAREEVSADSAAPSAAPHAGQLASARATADAVPPMQAAGALRKDGVDYQLLLQREFPAVWNGSEPATTVWVVMDANGKVLRKGELPPGATVSADQPFEVRNAWELVNVKTASGSSLQLAVTLVN